MQGQLPEILYFKDAEGAFEYSCKYSFAEIKEGQPRVALVESVGGQDGNGFQSALLRVAGSNDHFKVTAQTAAAFVPTLKTGELVLWLPMQIGAWAGGVTDKRTAWLGLIVGVLAPELIVATHNYRLEIDYRNFVRPETKPASPPPSKPIESSQVTRAEKIQQLKEVLQPITGGGPAMGRFNGIGCTLLGQFHQPEFAPLYFTVLWFTFLWIPIWPTTIYLVSGRGDLALPNTTRTFKFYGSINSGDFFRLFPGQYGKLILKGAIESLAAIVVIFIVLFAIGALHYLIRGR